MYPVEWQSGAPEGQATKIVRARLTLSNSFAGRHAKLEYQQLRPFSMMSCTSFMRWVETSDMGKIILIVPVGARRSSDRSTKTAWIARLSTVARLMGR